VWVATPLAAPRLRLQEREDREHAPVGVGGDRQLQLLEDARDVLLDAALGQEDPGGDRRVRQPLGHQLEHLPLARSQLVERVVAAASADQLRDDARIERRAAPGDPLHSRDEVGNLPSPQAGYAQVPTNGNFVGTSSDLAFEWRRNIGETSDLRITSSYGVVNRPETGTPVAKTTTGEVKLQYRFKFARHHEMSVGLGDRVSSDQAPSAGATAFNPSQLTYQVSNGFAQDEIHLLNERLVFTLGAKIEHDIFGGWQLQPTARALWAPNKHHSMWASVSQAARTPSLYERSVNAEVASQPASPSTLGLPWVLDVTGSQQFRSENVTAYESGYRGQLSPRLSVDVAGFYDQYRHLRTQNILPSSVVFGTQPYLLVPFVFTNRMNARAAGAEFSVAYHPVSWWKLASSYSYLTVDFKLQNGAPSNTVNAAINAVPGNQWQIQSYLNLSHSVQLDTFVSTASSHASEMCPRIASADMSTLT